MYFFGDFLDFTKVYLNVCVELIVDTNIFIS